MKNNKVFIGLIILAILGGIIVYYVAFREEEMFNANPSKSNHPEKDSLEYSGHEIIPSEMGLKPEKNPTDGSVKIVEEFIKLNSKNPATLQFLEWSEISIEDGYWKVRCKYTGISSFDAEVTTNAWFYIRNNKVAHTKIISKI